LKRQKVLSAHFGDILSELYLLSATLKRRNDEGCYRKAVVRYGFAEQQLRNRSPLPESCAARFDRLVAWLCAGKVGAVLCFVATCPPTNSIKPPDMIRTLETMN
jgi:hypothetical protein